MRYTAFLLRFWKRVAEARAARKLESYWSLDAAGDEIIRHEGLIKEFLAAHRSYCARLPYVALGVGRSIGLEDVYVPVRLRRMSSQKSDASTNELSIADLLTSEEFITTLITGLPGSGKSTTLRFMAAHAWHQPHEIGLTTPYLPMLVPAGRLAKESGSLEMRLRTVISDEYALQQTLPEHFLRDWPERIGADWLLVIDGIDQVSTETKAQFLGWLRAIITHAERVRVVLSCRSNSIQIIRSGLELTSCEEFEICPLDPVEAVSLANNWVGADQIRAFENQLETISDFEIRYTPLFTTIAARVFCETQPLPLRRAQLYEAFVDVCLKAARLQGLSEEIDPRLRDSVKPLLAFIGQLLVRPGSSGLSATLASWLVDQFHFSEQEARNSTDRLLQTLAERTGIFVARGNSYDFVHPTFLHYLSAYHFAHQTGEDSELLQFGVSRFLLPDPAWHESLVFLAGILSDKPERSTALLGALFEKHRWQRRFRIFSLEVVYDLFLLAACLADGAVMLEPERTRVLEAIRDAATSTKTDLTMRILFARELTILNELTDPGLLTTLVRHSEVTTPGQVLLVECMYRCKCLAGLIAVACESAFGQDIRIMATANLGALGCVKALMEVLGRLGRPDNPISIKVIDELSKLEPYAELHAIATTTGAGGDARVIAVMLLSSFGQREILLSIACNQDAEYDARSTSLLSLLQRADETRHAALRECYARGVLNEVCLGLLKYFKRIAGDSSLSEEARGTLVTLLTLVLQREVTHHDVSDLSKLLAESIQKLQK